jgi:5-methylcytosine-specific restriction endonuclease McrA
MPFSETQPTREDYWRSVILFGRNVASYKFALAKSLLELATNEPNFIRLNELAVPFSRHVAEHLARVDKQATSSSSRFLEACRQFNAGGFGQDALVQKTVSLGFQNVIDAFHVVNREAIPVRFFLDERKQRGGIVITDDFLKLKETFQFANLPLEIEARWRLVETAWDLSLHPALLSVRYDRDASAFYVWNLKRERIDVTSSRDALDGYQKGKCFYCLREISIVPTSPKLADVDHFFPHTLLVRGDIDQNLDGVWNLVLACQECNRGQKGKATRIPKIRYLERLHQRNNYLIESHHPLRDTLISQTGATEFSRQQFLQQQYVAAKSLLIHEWAPVDELEAIF